MGDSANINNLSQGEREGLFASVKAGAAQGEGNQLLKTGDTATGLINFTGGTVVTSTATLSTSNINTALINNALIGSTATISLLQSNQFLGASLASLAEANIYSVNASENALILSSTVLSGVTIAPLKIFASTASQAFFDFRGGVISTASLNLAANKMAGVIQVSYVGEGGVGMGYIPIFKGVS